MKLGKKDQHFKIITPEKVLTAPEKTLQPQPENSAFSRWDREFVIYCDMLDKHGVALMEIKRELLRGQQMVRLRYEKAEEERDKAIESNERLMLRLLNLMDDLTVENAKKIGEKPLPEILENVGARLMDCLRNEGVSEIPVQMDAVFNPLTCNAVPGPIDNTKPQDTVVRVLSPGYTYGLKKLRNAKVEVTKKGEAAKQ